MEGFLFWRKLAMKKKKKAHENMKLTEKKLTKKIR